MSEPIECIVVGAGHNGLVCAAYLAKSGRGVLVLEAADKVGGAAITRELAPGFQVPACAHILHHLHPKVRRDLRLGSHGLRLACKELPTVALDREGGHVTISGDTLAGAVSEADRRAWRSWNRRLSRFARHLRPFLAAAPPRLGGGGRGDRRNLMKLGWAIRSLGRADMREFLRVGGMNVADLLEESFETDLLGGAVALDAVLGTRLGPRSPSSVLTLLYRLAAPGPPSLPEGGMGAVTAALAKAAEAAGARIRTASPVRRILVESDRVAGVELESGETLAASKVVSNADPRRTFLELLGAEHLDAGFVRKVANIRMRGTAAKLNLALDGAPDFTGLDRKALGGRLLIAPSIDYLERAFNPVKYGQYAAEPAMEITIPSLHDPGLAPEGRHVLSAVVQYVPYELKAGWAAGREALSETLLDLLEGYAPGIRSRIVASELLTPADIEREFRMTGGHWHHGELAMDQMFMLRPVPGAAQYAAPVPGLYLCGAGAHPGGGVMGAAGMNAAARLIAQEAPAA